MNEDIIEWAPSSMLEVRIEEPDDFLKIKETLTRIGVSSKKEQNTLYQSCHILHKQGRYFIVHFKELFTNDDFARRNTIATLLSDWGLLEVVIPEQASPKTSLRSIKIISHRDKKEWNLESKYSIGNVKTYK